MSWKYVKLSSLCKTGSGGTPLKSKKGYYENGNIPWLRSGEVNNRNIVECEIKITSKGLNESSAKLFPPRTVLIAMYGATAGQVGILNFECSTNQAVCGILPNEKIIPEFIYYKFLEGKEALVKQAVGGAQPNISQIKIKNTLIPDIPLSEQKHIVSILDLAFKAIDKAKANAEQNLKNAKELFESYLQGVFDPSTRSGQEGDGWEEKTLQEVCHKITDGSHNPPKSKDSGRKMASGRNVTENGLDLRNVRFITNEEFEKEDKRTDVKPGDVLLTIVGTIGHSLVYPEGIEKITFQRSVAVLKPKLGLDSNFLSRLFISKQYQVIFENKARGAAQKGIYLKTLRTLTIPFPSLIVQKEIVHKLDVLSTETKKLESIYKQKILSLDELKKSVLQKAFAGELTISEP